MASSSTSSLHFLLFLLLISQSYGQQSFRPHALVLPVAKDAATLQYVTHVNQRTPLVSVNLVIDLGGRFLWVDCDLSYVSSSYLPARCRSAQCSLAKSTSCGECFSSPKPGCNNNTCGLFPGNPFISTSTSGELAQDVLSLQSTDGSNPGTVVTVPRFLFTCGSTFLLEGLANGAKGIAGLGRMPIAFPSQFASAFSFHRKFAICLSSSTTSNGVIFFGDGPYVFLLNKELSNSLIYTPLLTNPVSTAGVSTQGEPSYEYFIGVKSIKISEKRVPLNASLLSIDNNGFGGTKISTVNPYTTLETSIYKAFSEAFIREATSRNITRAAPVAPFDVCFSSKGIGSTRVGPAVPWVDLVLQSENVYWRIFGANSMVYVNDDVVCLAFVDGGSNPRTSIVIGGYQLEDNLLQFDLATSRLGFTSSLLFRQTTCANFNFTSNV
ncbi:probable aspartic proteinase GIP2 [Magnolia sinica]|uniref:probable aspartic proteinase GIP2 n=1 Tax=Magnolia sinica TaxID=86752 RepID=UPI00265A3E9F|nr:probable aspartic proteinase GIP2 [Magnolia sinica]